jgi:predicted ArsR family transcriptional regulator
MAYPDTPGFKARETSAEAARSVGHRAAGLRAHVLASITSLPGTPEEVAARLGQPVHSIRPRFSELAAKGLIEDSGERGEAMGGKRAIRWRAA